MAEFGNSLKHLLALHNLTQLALAKAMGCTPSYLSLLVTGRRKPSPPCIDQIVSVLNLDKEKTTDLHTLAAREHGFRV